MINAKYFQTRGQYYNRVTIVATIVIQKSLNVLLINNSVRDGELFWVIWITVVATIVTRL